jgi:hypothetical protein
LKSIVCTTLSGALARFTTSRMQMSPNCLPVMENDPSLADVAVPNGEKEYGGWTFAQEVPVVLAAMLAPKSGLPDDSVIVPLTV